MSTYNILHALVDCPRCGAVVGADIECRCGDTTQMVDLRIGDIYPWVRGRQPQNGGRPKGGRFVGDGYMECPTCKKDLFLRVVLDDDKITAVEPDSSRRGYIPD